MLFCRLVNADYRYLCHQVAEFDVLVTWDGESRGNVVSSSDIELDGGTTWRIGAKIKMWWAPERKWYKGEIAPCVISKF